MKNTPETIETVKALKRMLRPGKTVYCVLRHVSSSGMSRRIDFYTLSNGRMAWLSGYMANLGIARLAKHPKSGLTVEGCGMDMGFHCVYSFGRILWPEGFKLAKNQHGRNGDKSGFDKDGGYALKSEWL